MSGLITDTEARKALREVASGRKNTATLTDPAPRGEGRLVLMVRAGVAEWYGQRFVAGKRRLSKLGAYPAMSIKDAREAFAQAGAPAEQKPTPVGTIGDLFDAYVEALRAEGKPSADQVEEILTDAGSVIGRDKLAAEVTPDDIVSVIRPVYDRGARVLADKYRMYLGAAFRRAMRTTHDYRADRARDWGITANPVDAVARDSGAERVGTRRLTEAEFRALLGHVTGPTNRKRTRVQEAVAVIMLTGQRVREILNLRADQWDSAERVIRWHRTKNGRPHALPVCERAAAILDALVPIDGWLFPCERRTKDGARKPQPDGAVLVWLKRYADDFGVDPFNGRDLRRTWKTLSGAAGLTKVEKDLLQNHSEGDVSSVHYDYWEYMPEKRAAVAKWEAWLRAEAVTV